MDVTQLLSEFIEIPEVRFQMGTPEADLSMLAKRYGGTRESYREESPQHTLSVPSFRLARVPVTNALYGVYTAATGATPPLKWRGLQPSPELLDHPVVDVSWNEAHDCCAWITDQLVNSQVMVRNLDGRQTILHNPNVTIRLPSEAEWEHAARGTDGRMFPWGTDFDVDRANTREAGRGTTPVEYYPLGASPYDVLDMAGNVWEWTGTLDKRYPYDYHDGREQAETAGRRILRGGCYANPAGFARCACRFRLHPTVRNEFVGFRLAF